MAANPSTEKPLGTDEELAPSRRLPTPTDGGTNGLPTHVHRSDSENIEPKHGHTVTSARAAWNRFNGHGRKRVGAVQSAKAVLFSSCVCFPSLADVLEFTPDPQT